jgi:hypothetical protein
MRNVQVKAARSYLTLRTGPVYGVARKARRAVSGLTRR